LYRILIRLSLPVAADAKLGRGEAAQLLRKLIYIIVILAVISFGLYWAAVQAVKPDQSLDLKYKEVSVVEKMLDIVKNRKLEVQLTEQDVNNLVKKQLSQQADMPHNGVTITGAQFKLHGDRVEADVNLLWNNKVAAAAKLIFLMEWKNPDLEITHLSTQIKQMQVPQEWFHLNPIRIPMAQSMPRMIGIKDVAFDPGAIRIMLMLK
jgi:hypothetical protein